MSQRMDIISIAQAEIDYKESANNANKFGAWYGMNNQPWCAMFISWCAAMAKVPLNIIPKTAWVPDYQAFFSKLGRYFTPAVYKPRAGDLVLYGSNSHVGLVESVSDAKVTTIEGNTSANGNSTNGDGVYRRVRYLNDTWIRGYCSPDYIGDEQEMDIAEIMIRHNERGLIAVKGVNIAGENYVRLRDMEKIAPVAVGWDGKNPTVAGNYIKQA